MYANSSTEKPTRQSQARRLGAIVSQLKRACIYFDPTAIAFSRLMGRRRRSFFCLNANAVSPTILIPKKNKKTKKLNLPIPQKTRRMTQTPQSFVGFVFLHFFFLVFFFWFLVNETTLDWDQAPLPTLSPSLLFSLAFVFFFYNSKFLFLGLLSMGYGRLAHWLLALNYA